MKRKTVRRIVAICIGLVMALNITLAALCQIVTQTKTSMQNHVTTSNKEAPNVIRLDIHDFDTEKEDVIEELDNPIEGLEEITLEQTTTNDDNQMPENWEELSDPPEAGWDTNVDWETCQEPVGPGRSNEDASTKNDYDIPENWEDYSDPPEAGWDTNVDWETCQEPVDTELNNKTDEGIVGCPDLFILDDDISEEEDEIVEEETNFEEDSQRLFGNQ